MQEIIAIEPASSWALVLHFGQMARVLFRTAFTFCNVFAILRFKLWPPAEALLVSK
eukprot:CAMPEP_0169421878 /NCGR_PEP_ID=MMETSP1017-20121227/66553_1 /TAXON_ID=342587 /ORGANISM="Karlodinium micrum, Strain CCMP2283" /LENGTH=55 /DNA_ID=CAMNT_0009531247 /DNA_START=92 /DNA_END=259 /DNA_ORIENTATION=+